MITTKDVTAEAADVFFVYIARRADVGIVWVAQVHGGKEKKGEFDGSTVSDYGG